MTRIANVERIVHAHSDQLQELYSLIDGGNLPKFGIFFNDQIFDAYVFSSEWIASARQSIVLLDNYIDEKTLLQLSKRDSRVDCAIYTAMVNDQLRLDLEKHNAQYPRIELRVKKHFHDRFLIIDGKELYHLGASLKDLGKRWFAFSRMDELLSDVMSRLGLWGDKWKFIFILLLIFILKFRIDAVLGHSIQRVDVFFVASIR